MLRRLLVAAAAALSIPAGQALAASPYDTIYSFGDSLSDAGNLLLYTSQPGSPVPAQPVYPYSDGRFSNGNVWVQDLSQMLGLGPVTPSLAGGNDYAWGDATTGYPGTLNPAAPVPTLADQVTDFSVANGGVAPSNALYTFSIGANDIFSALQQGLSDGALTAAINGAAQTVATEAGVLQSEGAKDLVLFDVPDLGVTPGIRALGPIASAEASALAAFFDGQVLADLAPVEAAGLTVLDLNTYQLIDQIVGPPQSPEFTNVTDPCWTGTATGGISSGTLCSDTQAGQDQYLFWDDVHPTAAGHLLVAEDARYQLTGVVPEPATWAMMALGFAGLGALGARKVRSAAAAG